MRTLAAPIPARDVNHQELDVNVRFVDVTQQASITFRQMGGNFQEGFLPMEKGSGVAFGDYNNDGNLDFYIVNIPTLDSPEVKPNALYRNEGDGRFTDVAEVAGVADVGFGMGCVFGDYDNDGDLDLYVTNYGANILYRNNGNGTFTDVTKSAGVRGDGINTGAAFDAFSMGAAFADYDNDGFLDLYVANYIDYSKNPPDKRPVFPYDFIGGTNILYRNNGDGTFSDVTFAARVDNGFHLSLGVTFGDYDNDGDVDLYVANDTDPNVLFRNNGDGTFANTNYPEAYKSNTGDTRSGMGVTFGDYDNDGDLDLFVANWQDENNVLYRNNGDGTFTDVTAASGLFEDGIGRTSFGAEFFDYDNDGYLDIFIANGHVNPIGGEFERARQPNLLYRNNGDGTFTDVSNNAGINRGLPKISRGAAFGDYDNDGDVDILIVNAGDTPTLLRNEGGNKNHWLHIKTVGTKSNRDGIGARVKVVCGDLVQIREVVAGSSYLSCSSLMVEFGLGKRTKVDLVEIRWPSGIVQRLKNVSADQVLTVVEK